MRLFNVASFVVASLAILSTGIPAVLGGKVTAYVTDWSIGSGLTVSKIPWDKLDHVIYAFAEVGSATKLTGVTPGNLHEVVTAAHKNKKPVSIAIGGWTGGKPFSDIMSSANGRSTFVKTIVSFMNQYNLDGANIDWEYPSSRVGMICNSVRAQDTDNFVAFLHELRTTLGNSKLISIAAQLYPFNDASFKQSKSATNFADVPGLIIYVMGYDVNGDENDIAAPNAPLGKLVHNLSETVSDGVDAWLKAGIPANRLSLGVPFYGLTFKMAGNGKAMYDRILHPQPQGDQDDSDSPDPCPGAKKGFSGSYNWNHLFSNRVLSSPSTAASGWTREFDPVSQTPYVYSAKTHILISYDDPESLKAKVSYLKSKGMEGAMIWSLDMDDSQHSLLNALQGARA